MLGPAEQEELTGLVSENLKMFPRLNLALSTDDLSPRENLQKELPGAVVVVWGEMQQDQFSSTLLNAVSENLISVSGGDEANKSLEELEEHGHIFPSTYDFVAQFEAQEVARQRAEMLRSWVERAGFSESERRVYEFDLRIGTDFETKAEATNAAARALNVETETVRGFRKRYRDKLRKAAGT